jgi:hypothetical protein
VSSNQDNARNEFDESRLQSMRDSELLDLIRETVQQLNTLGDRLEVYAERRASPDDPKSGD